MFSGYKDGSRERWPMALPRVRNVWTRSVLSGKATRQLDLHVVSVTESIPTERQAGKL